MPEEYDVPIDGSASELAYEAFLELIGSDMIDGWEEMLKGGWTPEVICSYAAGQVPELVYNLILSAVRYAEIKLNQKKR